jgi:hypothetical protein
MSGNVQCVNVLQGYEQLLFILTKALNQAQHGKGKERHAVDGQAFEDQQICEITRRVGLGYPLGQAMKKIIESQRLPIDMAAAELLGAINYIAAAYLVRNEERADERKTILVPSELPIGTELAKEERELGQEGDEFQDNG